MRSFAPAELTYLQARTGVSVHVLVWISARNRSTGATETLGLWTGDEDRSFVIGGASRSYLGAGGILGLEPLMMQTGLVVQMQELRLSFVTPEVQSLILTYDAAFAPVQIHRAFFDTTTGALVAEPRRVWSGYVDRAPLPTPEIGGEAALAVQMTSAARALTRPLTLTKSDAVQKARGGDGFRRYQDVSGKVTVVWGEKRETAAAPATAPVAPGTIDKGGR